MKTLIIGITLLLLMGRVSLAQRQVALTIDDVPNTVTYKDHDFESQLLHTTDSLQIPVTVFIVESNIYKTDSVVQNFRLLDHWIQRDYITPGNHSFTHLHYSTAGFVKFTRDLLKGEAITRELARKEQKELKYFRFPYNDLGADSAQHDSITRFLEENNYTAAPFTI